MVRFFIGYVAWAHEDAKSGAKDTGAQRGKQDEHVTLPA
jgi:hypothetical protein